jgi:hypothetical protein
LAKHPTFSLPLSRGFNDDGGRGGLMEAPATPEEEENPPGAILAPEVQVEAGLLPLPEVHLFPTPPPPPPPSEVDDEDMPELGDDDGDGEDTFLEAQDLDSLSPPQPELEEENSFDGEDTFLEEEWNPDLDNLPPPPPALPPPPQIPAPPPPPPTPVPKEWATLYGIFGKLQDLMGGGENDDEDDDSDEGTPPRGPTHKRRGEVGEEHSPRKKPALDGSSTGSDTEEMEEEHEQMEALRK